MRDCNWIICLKVRTRRVFPGIYNVTVLLCDKNNEGVLLRSADAFPEGRNAGHIRRWVEQCFYLDHFLCKATYTHVEDKTSEDCDQSY